MRYAAILPIVLNLAAFILSMLCLFGGSTPGFLEQGNLLTLNTAGLHPKAGSGSAKALKIPDFYSVHVLDFCEGNYKSSGATQKSVTPAKKVTSCSKPTALFHFDATAVLQHELKIGSKLTQLQWPSAVADGIKAAGLASKVMSVVYCIGILTTTFTLIGALISLFAVGKMSALVNLTLSMFACFCFMVASATATGIINSVVGLVNTHGAAVGLSATKGMTFIGMTWAADLLMLLVGFVWLGSFYMARREELSYVSEYQEEY